MNLLDILSSGKRSLREENVSSLLAWFLDPGQSHGCGPLFLKRLLVEIDNTSSGKFRPWIDGLSTAVAYRKQTETNAAVTVEEEVHSFAGNKRDVDIVIRLTRGGKDTHILGIENKISEQACKPTQLKEEYEGLVQEYEGATVSFLYLTPRKSSKSKKAFDLLPQDMTKFHMTWAKSGSSSFIKILRGVLHADAEAEIEPLSHEVKFVLKSLIMFAENGFKPERYASSAPEPGKPFSYKGAVTGLEELRALFEERKDVYIGFWDGIPALKKADLAELQDRRFKWDDNLEHKKKTNWIGVSEFKKILEQKENA